jgi:hypothetical protein
MRSNITSVVKSSNFRLSTLSIVLLFSTILQVIELSIRSLINYHDAPLTKLEYRRRRSKAIASVPVVGLTKGGLVSSVLSVGSRCRMGSGVSVSGSTGDKSDGLSILGPADLNAIALKPAEALDGTALKPVEASDGTALKPAEAFDGTALKPAEAFDGTALKPAEA